ncbi:hypothetical protein GJA_3974 [Janthinobacterium agaricidamnosum NBRC 102515 = DSM 9628]|uniref:Uncharacterized protein n=1 Tax=Janthinobacterium agaricidamnosum NBRC 102515 = DSM 9628 TaxID=1349767 RepID=W0VAG9_9BURK|nr:hypothetical protein GJA_3974 [Janthinobacterium agaricidamnosum NBRC 102515 = DSM 9628]
MAATSGRNINISLKALFIFNASLVDYWLKFNSKKKILFCCFL